jgi:hypothetical protein
LSTKQANPNTEQDVTIVQDIQICVPHGPYWLLH